MKNKVLFSTVILLTLLCHASARQEGIAAATATPQEHIEQSAAPWLDVALERLLTYDRLATVLEKVEDKISAEAAITETQNIVQHLKELDNKEKSLNTPTADVAAYVEAQLADTDIAALSERVIGKILELLARTDPPCHGCRELSKELYSFAVHIMATD